MLLLHQQTMFADANNTPIIHKTCHPAHCSNFFCRKFFTNTEVPSSDQISVE